MRVLWVVLFCLVQAHAASHRPMEFIQSVSHQPNEAEKIYQSFCKNCHAPKPLIPLGAPRIGYSSEWKGRKDFLKSTLEGKGLMPARGGCFECSDEQLKKVIDYMINFKEKN